MVRVELRESTVALLMVLRSNDHESLDAVTARLAHVALPGSMEKPALSAADSPIVSERPKSARGKYRLEVLGRILRADALGALFAELIDSLVEVAPEAVEGLAEMQAHTRRYVARDRSAIHPGRPDLPTLPTRSGWWVSANIGTVDLERALRAVCEASLALGDDVRFLRASSE